MEKKNSLILLGLWIGLFLLAIMVLGESREEEIGEETWSTMEFPMTEGNAHLTVKTESKVDAVTGKPRPVLLLRMIFLGQKEPTVVWESSSWIPTHGHPNITGVIKGFVMAVDKEKQEIVLSFGIGGAKVRVIKLSFSKEKMKFEERKKIEDVPKEKWYAINNPLYFSLIDLIHDERQLTLGLNWIANTTITNIERKKGSWYIYITAGNGRFSFHWNESAQSWIAEEEK